jgi:hypothetical protein
MTVAGKLATTGCVFLCLAILAATHPDASKAFRRWGLRGATTGLVLGILLLVAGALGGVWFQ